METAHSFALEAKGIEKSFGGTRALRGVDIQIDAGQCLGLVGRNGAGKSTLVSILCGLESPDAGQVFFRGEPAPSMKNLEAWRGQIATVFQHSKVVPQLSVVENVFLGQLIGRRGLVDWNQMREQTQVIIDEWNFDVPVDVRCETLTVEQLQIVEIVRALATKARCILLDEPTAALERKATGRLFERVRQLVEGGVAVLYISHHLEEVFEICRDVVVLRDGEAVLSSPIAQLNKEQMVTAMVGDLPTVTDSVLRRVGETLRQAETNVATRHASTLVVEDLTAASPRGALRGVSFRIAPGERVGVTGLLSAGVATLGRVVAGSDAWDSGRVVLGGRELEPGRRDLTLKAGVGYVPEDRQAEGFVAHLGIAENCTMTITKRLANAFGLLRPFQLDKATAPLAQALSLVSSGPRQPVGELSGGNQQKVTVIGALIGNPGLIVAVTPTRGVDVASKPLLLNALVAAADSTGAGLLLCSDELDDFTICDRVIVLLRGEVLIEFSQPPFDREALIAATEGLLTSDRTVQ